MVRAVRDESDPELELDRTVRTKTWDVQTLELSLK